ncbi:hypothetical protein FRC04_009458 [Tulasnella sp. 424]|nr:hypothetical protein FRC04_009458 [Tulasnella sp. 424]KAG8971911.1 hypothetical protein FRC05_010580 [Tulasnella sp. 425]
MRFAPILVVLAAPLLALSKVVINNTSYSGGHLTLGISTYSDAPSSFNVVAVDGSGNKITIGTVTTQGSGTFDLALPGNATPGSYKVQVVDPATGETLSTSRSFTVSSADLAAASSQGLQSASYTYAVTGSIIPFVTTSLVTDASGTHVATVTVSGPTPAGSAESVSSVSATSVLPSTTLTVTTNTVSTGSSGTSTLPLTQTITGLVSTGTNSNGAATATLLTATTTTTRNAGFKNTVSGGAFALVAAVIAGAAMLY